MGLLNSNDDVRGCDQVIADCVGKIGECPVVTSIEDCKFDRKDQVLVKEADCVQKIVDSVFSDGTTTTSIKEFDEIDMTMEDFYKQQESDCCSCDDCGCDSGCCDTAGTEWGIEQSEQDVPTEKPEFNHEFLKNMLDEVIGVMVKYHNMLQ